MRATRATRAVLALWERQADALLSEADVEAALHADGVAVNRVTVYRLLDRLASAGLLRRSVDAARVARFARPVQGVARDADAAAHFECADCHSAFRLGDASLQAALQQLRQALAASGLQGQAIDVAVTGLCRDCGGGPTTTVRGTA
jgi:Fur family ferric uptake transcriptional regulator